MVVWAFVPKPLVAALQSLCRQIDTRPWAFGNRQNVVPWLEGAYFYHIIDLPPE